MNNETKPEGQAQGQQGPEASIQPGESQSGPPQGQAAPSDPANSAPPDNLAGQMVLDKLMAENADLKDKLLRTHAEMENIRKRTDREKAEAHKYAVTKFARDIVTVGDNFQRAIESVPAAAAEQSATLKSFLEGVTMTERELINTLERHGIKRLDPKGQPFNPHHHQAVSEVQNAEVPNGTVTQVFQCGYLIEDRVLRPAMVVVAKGGPKVAAKPAEAGNGAASGSETAAQQGDTRPEPANDDAPPQSESSV